VRPAAPSSDLSRNADEGFCSSGPVTLLVFQPLDAIAQARDLGLHRALQCCRCIGTGVGAPGVAHGNCHIVLEVLHCRQHALHLLQQIRPQPGLLALKVLQPLVDLDKALVDLSKALVDLREALVDLGKAPVDLGKALVDRLEMARLLALDPVEALQNQVQYGLAHTRHPCWLAEPSLLPKP